MRQNVQPSEENHSTITLKAPTCVPTQMIRVSGSCESWKLICRKEKMTMINIPDHPTIRAMERTGYPHEIDASDECPRCGGILGEYAYELDGEMCCVDCFREAVTDYMQTNPIEVAKALRYVFAYVG